MNLSNSLGILKDRLIISTYETMLCGTKDVAIYRITVKIDLLFQQVHFCYWIVLNLTTPILLLKLQVASYVFTTIAARFCKW